MSEKTEHYPVPKRVKASQQAEISAKTYFDASNYTVRKVSYAKTKEQWVVLEVTDATGLIEICLAEKVDVMKDLVKAINEVIEE